MRQLIILFFFIAGVNNVFAQSDSSTLKSNLWLQASTGNAISKSTRTGSFNAAPAGFALYFINADTVSVPYLVYIPKQYDPAKQHALIVYLHGGIGGMENFQHKNPAFSQEPVFALADKYNAVVLFPYGRRSFGWLWQTEAFENVLRIIREVKQTYNIHASRVYLGGMSNGAMAAFWFITNKPDEFAGFYGFSPVPKLLTGEINFGNITGDKPLYTLNAKDDEGFPFEKIRSLYAQHKEEAPGWDFDSVNTGGHGFIYDDNGLSSVDKVIGKMLNRKTVLKESSKDSLKKVLFQIDENDQKYRNQMESVRAKYGGDSKEMKTLLGEMKTTDSMNLIPISAVIETYGWLGADEIGSQGNTTLFMVIQHSELETQLVYLPLMREAVKNGKAEPSSLALMEDRVALRQGRKQIYGSQLSWNMKTNEYYVLPLDDPDNVDKRRAEMQLEPLADYVKKCCDLVWDAEQYKKALPALEADFFKPRKENQH